MKTIKVSVLSIGMLAASVCGAGEGSFEINQACADIGCFPGDAPGLPVTITQPGRYDFVGNLTVADTVTSAVVVSASNVTIDMKGFRIVGPTTCTGTPIMCTPTASGVGIDAWNSNPTNVVVSNGSIFGMGTGLLVSYDGRAERVQTIQNVDAGIRARTGAGVFESTGTSNGNTGIESRLTIGCVASGNGGYGLASGGGLIKDSIAQNNEYGIYLGMGTSVIGATLNDNVVGIFALGESQVVDSMFRNNTLVGIQNTQGMIAIARSTFVGNNGGGAQWGGSAVELAPNMCGTSTTCP